MNAAAHSAPSGRFGAAGVAGGCSATVGGVKVASMSAGGLLCLVADVGGGEWGIEMAC